MFTETNVIKAEAAANRRMLARKAIVLDKATDVANNKDEDTESAPMEDKAAEVATIEIETTGATDPDKKEDTNDDHDAKLAETRLSYAKRIPICRMIADKARVGHPNFKDMSLMARSLEHAGVVSTEDQLRLIKGKKGAKKAINVSIGIQPYHLPTLCM